jgi:hypothetical protein
MRSRSRIGTWALVAALAALPLCRVAPASAEATTATQDQKVKQRSSLEALRQLSEETQPGVAELTGLPCGEMVEVDMMSRAELISYLRRTVELEYPGHQLQRRSRCFWEIGLVPKGYDLEAGFIDLIAEQAGALYDPHTKALVGLSDLPQAMAGVATQKLIVSHELCHALQDRKIDILGQSQVCLDDLDREYAFRATIEGMATVLMLAYSQNWPVEQVPDARAMMRAGFVQNENNPSMARLAASPDYVKELLLSPYADGAAFNQAWLKANPGVKIGALLDRMPVTSEQVLHFDKYAEDDRPAPIDVAAAAAVLPAGWSFLYANTLGEFDLRMLFEGCAETRAVASAAAEGWDGLRFEAYTDSSDNLLLMGLSAWDSEDDAKEFRDAFTSALAATNAADGFSVARAGSKVAFVVGPIDAGLRGRLLDTLARAD